MEPVLVKSFDPCEALQGFIRKYQVYRFSFEKGITPPVKFYTPRPEHSITFYLRDPQRFRAVESDQITTYPRCVINGIYSMPLHRYGGRDFCAIKVILQPATLFHLKLVPVKELNDTYINAEDHLGSELSELCEKLLELNDLKEMLLVIEAYFTRLLSRRNITLDSVDRVSQFIAGSESGRSLPWLAGQSCLSVRQFIRRFEEKVGVGPKLFQKIARFDGAYRLKNRNPGTDWLYIALASGYYDYQHLAKDFKQFARLTPPAFYEVDQGGPERYFSLCDD